MSEALLGAALSSATLSLDTETPEDLFYAAGWACTLLVEWHEHRWASGQA